MEWEETERMEGERQRDLRYVRKTVGEALEREPSRKMIGSTGIHPEGKIFCPKMTQSKNLPQSMGKAKGDKGVWECLSLRKKV